MKIRRSAGACAALLTALVTVVSAGQSKVDLLRADLGTLLQHAGQRVTEYFARAQSLVCLEKVSLQKLGMGFSADGPARFVESELRLSWEPTDEDPIPSEAKTLRQVLRVNGGKPRKNDWDNCTTPEQQNSETQPLSILLPKQRDEHTFRIEGVERVDGRDAMVIAFREVQKPKVDVSMVEDKEDCISFDVEGGMRGRIWIDVETHDVLRLDRSLVGMVEIPLPKKATRLGGNWFWTMERWDSSTRFKRVQFQDPEESMVLPVSQSVFQVTRGAGTPRLRTQTQYTAYRRFITGGRVVTQQQQ